jgi:hypothetical protein
MPMAISQYQQNCNMHVNFEQHNINRRSLDEASTSEFDKRKNQSVPIIMFLKVKSHKLITDQA